LIENEFIAIYRDSELTDRVDSFHLGEAEVGTVVNRTFYVKNISEGSLNDFKIELRGDEPIPLVQAPSIIPRNGVGKVLVSVKVPLSLRKSLRYSVRVSSKIIYS